MIQPNDASEERQRLLYDQNYNSGYDKPVLVLKYPQGSIIFVYKDFQGKTWLECTPDHEKPNDTLLLGKLNEGYLEPLVEFHSEDEES